MVLFFGKLGWSQTNSQHFLKNVYLFWNFEIFPPPGAAPSQNQVSSSWLLCVMEQLCQLDFLETMVFESEMFGWWKEVKSDLTGLVTRLESLQRKMVNNVNLQFLFWWASVLVKWEEACFQAILTQKHLNTAHHFIQWQEISCLFLNCSIKLNDWESKGPTPPMPPQEISPY